MQKRPDPFESISDRLKSWLPALTHFPESLYLVGGAIRDREMGRPITDIDLACTDAEKVATQLAAGRDATVIPFLKNPAAPCYRVVRRSDPADQIDIAELRGRQILDDLGHRDFTINAMAVEIHSDGSSGRCIDPFDGRDDIRSKRIRMTAPAVFTRDPLRMIRAVRFAADLGFTITPDTGTQIRRHAGRIDQIAGERIWTELKRIFQHPDSCAYIRLMDELALLEGIFPEIGPMKTCPQNAYHHLDVWPHTLAVLTYCEEIIAAPASRFGPAADQITRHLSSEHRLTLLKLTALLHDIGKPATRKRKISDGRMTFYGHDKTGARMTEDIARRLRLSAVERSGLVTMVAEHLHILVLAMPDVTPSARMRLFRKLKDNTISLIIHGAADVLATRGPRSSDAYRRSYLDWAGETLATFGNVVQPRLSPDADNIRGRDLINLGMAPGPDMGQTLDDIRKAWDDGQVHDHATALALARKLIEGKKTPGEKPRNKEDADPIDN